MVEPAYTGNVVQIHFDPKNFFFNFDCSFNSLRFWRFFRQKIRQKIVEGSKLMWLLIKMICRAHMDLVIIFFILLLSFFFSFLWTSFPLLILFFSWLSRNVYIRKNSKKMKTGYCSFWKKGAKYSVFVFCV